MIQAIRVVQKLVNTTVMRGLGVEFQRINLPQCDSFAEDSDEYWNCAIQYNTRAENHQTGTARMGPVYDRMAVVSPRLKVHGIKGLRVADASVQPRVSCSFSSRVGVSMIRSFSSGGLGQPGRLGQHGRRAGGRLHQAGLGRRCILIKLRNTIVKRPLLMF